MFVCVCTCVCVCVYLCVPVCVCVSVLQPALPARSRSQCLCQTTASVLISTKMLLCYLVLGMALLERSAKTNSNKLVHRHEIFHIVWLAWCKFQFNAQVLSVYFCAVSSNACTVSVNHPSLSHLYVDVSQNMRSCLSLSFCHPLFVLFTPLPISVYLCHLLLSLIVFVHIHVYIQNTISTKQ